MRGCPNKNLPEWQALVDNDKIGEFEAMKDWMQYEDIRTPEEVLEKLYPVSASTLKKRSKNYYPDRNIKNKYFKNSNTQKASVILKKIASSNHPLNKLATHLLKYIAINDVNIELKDVEFINLEGPINEARGVFYPDTNRIEIASEANVVNGLSEKVLLHEILHALSYAALRNQSSANEAFNVLYEDTMKKLGKYDPETKTGLYGTYTIDEFFVALFQDSEFITILQKLPPSNIKKFKNKWEEIIDFLLGLISIKKTDSLYTQAVAVASNIMDEYQEYTDNMRDYELLTDEILKNNLAEYALASPADNTKNIIKNIIKNELPIEISNTITVIQDVPLDILNRDDLFLSLKEFLNDNGVIDEVLINWVGINKNSLAHPKNIKSEQQITNIINNRYDKLKNVKNHPALKGSKLILESFNKWVTALEKFPIAFREVMLTHAIKYLNPQRRAKYVLQLSDVALNSVYNIVLGNKVVVIVSVNKKGEEVKEVITGAHSLNRIGKLYDQEVLKTVSDAVGHEPSASGKGYWVHIPRVENNRIEELKKELENLEADTDIRETELSNLEKLEPFEKVNEFNSGKRVYKKIDGVWNMTVKGGDFHPIKFPISQLEEDYNHFVLRTNPKLHKTIILNNKQRISEINKILEKNKGNDNSAQFKVNVELLRKLSPSTWCTTSDASAMEKVKNFEQYLLVVDGVTVAGIEAYPENFNIENKKRDVKEIEDNLENLDKGFFYYLNRKYSTINGKYIVDNSHEQPKEIFNDHKEKAKEKLTKDLQKAKQDLEKLNNSKIQVKEVTSRGNNGVASIDHLDDTIAFFEKHNLDLNNESIKNAINARNNGKVDPTIPQGEVDWVDENGHDENWHIDEHNGEHEYDPPEYDPGFFTHEQEVQANIVGNINTVQEALAYIGNNNNFRHVNAVEFFKPELKANEQVANAMVEKDAHSITFIDQILPFYKELAHKAVLANNSVYQYISEEAKQEPRNIVLHDTWLERRANFDDLPFSKTNDSKIQGYYDAKNDKVVVVAANTPVNEAAEIGIHEVFHRGFVRVARDLGEIDSLLDVMRSAKPQFMKKLPELLKRTGHTSLENLMKDYGFTTNSKEGELKLLSELGARWAETLVGKPKPAWWKKLLQSIRQWLKKFTGVTLNEKEVDELVGGFVRYGTLTSPSNNKSNNKSLLRDFKKLIKIASKEVSWQQRARINSDVASANTKLGTSFYVRFTQVGEADIYTWQIEDFKPAVEDDKIDPQLSLFYTEIINRPDISEMLETDENAEPLSKDEKLNEKSNIQGIDQLDKIAAAMSKALTYPYEFITAQEAADLLVNMSNKNKYKGQPAFVFNGKIYFVSEKVKLNMLFHEFAHPFVKSIRLNNRKLFDNLFKELGQTPEGAAIIQFVRDEYSEDLSNNEDAIMEECITKGLETATMKIKHSSGFMNFIKNLMYAIKQAFRKVFGQKIKIEKLTPTTSLEELSRMLINNEKIDLRLTNDNTNIAQFITEDISPFLKGLTESTTPQKYELLKTDLQKLLEKNAEIISKYYRELNSNKPISDDARNVFNSTFNKNMLEEMKAAVRPYTKGNLKLSIAQKDLNYVVKSASALINTLFNLRATTENIEKYLTEISNSKDPISIDKVSFFETFLNEWERFLEEGTNFLSENRTEPSTPNIGIPLDHPLEKLVDEIKKTIKTSQKKIQGIQQEGILTLITIALQPAMDNIDKKWKETQEELAKNNASPADIAKAKARYEGSKVTPEIIKASLTGNNGDSNVVQKIFEGYMYNNDPIIGGFTSYLTDNIINAELKAMQKYNALITKLNPLLAQWGKRVKWQKGQMGLLLGFRNLVGGRDENGNFMKKDEWEMLHNFKNYNADLAELNFQISELAEKVRIDNLDADKVALTAKKRDLKAWRIEFMHQKLIPDYYKRLELLTKDDIGEALSEKIDDIFDQINSLVLPTSSEADILNSYDLSAKLFRDYNRLASETDLKGNPKTGDELLIAQRMQEYKDKAKGMFDFIPKYRAFEDAFEKYEQELITKYNLTQQGATMYKNSPEYNYAMDAWFLKNLRTVILDTFWQDRKVIQDEIKSILSKLPTDLALQTQLDELYKQQTDLTKGYKDQDGQIIATQMSPELLAKLKTIGEDIDKIKDAIKFARSKEGGGPGIKLSKQDSKLLQKKMDELEALQIYEPTDYYIDTINEYLKDIDSPKMMKLLKTTQVTDVTLDLLLTNAPAMLELFDESPEFKTWFENNHSIKTKLVPTIKIDEETNEEVTGYKKEASYKRNYVWSRLRPRDDKYLEKYTFTKSNGDIMTVPGKPTTRYYTRVVKDEYYTGYDFKTGEINLIPNVHQNNKSQWLPRTDVSNKKYINERYIALKNSTNADDQVLFKILELLKEYHLDNQVGLEDNKKLYYSFPRFRKSFYEVLLTPGGVGNEFNQKMTKIGIIWRNIADFFRKAVDDYDVGVNPSDTWNLTNAEVNAELEYTDKDIPLIGLSGLEADLVSTDLMLSLHKYMYASQKTLTLKEMHPVARALKSVLENEKNKIRLTVAGKVDPDKDKKNTRLSTLQNLIDREFYGIRSVGVGSKNSFLQKTLTPFMFKRASFGFFSLNTVSAVKNTLGQKFQGLIESASGKHYNALEFFQAEGWASGAAMETFNAIYNPEQRSERLQMLDAFDVGEGRYEHIIGTESSRSLLQDVVGLTWLTNFRRAIELQATYQQFAAMMKRQKVKQNGVDINYIDAWEIKDKKFQLKPGIDAEWGITYDSDGNQYIGTEFKNFRKSVQSVARDINGAYANFQQPEMGRYLLGRQVQFMRKFFVTPLMNRFGFKGNILNPIPRLNMGLNDTKEGYYITTMQLVLRSIKNITKRMPYALKEEKQALAKVLTEVILLITMSMVLGPLFGYDPDDEKRFKKLRKKSGVMPFFGLIDEEQSEDFKLGGWLSNHALNMLIQVQAENGAWLKVSNYTSMLNISSIALGPTLTKYGEIWSNAIGSFKGDKKAEYQRDAGPYVWQQAHHAKVWNLLGSTLGITGTTKDPILHIKNTEGYQARK